MEKPILVVMAAGMGSRYGGLKQIDPIDPQGHIIMDFSVYDAVRAGFEKVIFIIKRENEKDFREPWGTGHAVLSCLDAVHGPLVVVNADDYYGKNAFAMAYEFLTSHQDSAEEYHYMMVGYHLENTLTENGHVSRGVCVTDEEGHLHTIHERTHIEKRDGRAMYTEDEGLTWTELPMDSTVSMNMWGFSESILKELKDRFRIFLEENLESNPLKCEYFLPFVVDELLTEKKATVKVLKSMDKWYGVTYKEDKPVVMKNIQRLKDEGIYPQALWED